MTFDYLSNKEKEIINEIKKLILDGVNPSIYRINLNTGIHKKTIKKYLKKGGF